MDRSEFSGVISIQGESVRVRECRDVTLKGSRVLAEHLLQMCSANVGTSNNPAVVHTEVIENAKCSTFRIRSNL